MATKKTHKKKSTHRRKGHKKMSGIGDTLEMALFAAGGAIVGEFLINTINTAVGSGVTQNDYVGDGVVLAAGLFIPSLLKGSIGQGIGFGMVAAGALNIVEDAGLIAGVMPAPTIAGPGNYVNRPLRRPMLAGYTTGNGAQIAGTGGMNTRSLAAIESMC